MKRQSFYDFCITNNRYDLLSLFDEEKNRPITTRDVSRASDKKVYFKYPCGHSTDQRIADMTKKGAKLNCPVCMNRRIGQVGKSVADVAGSLLFEFCEDLNHISAAQIP